MNSDIIKRAYLYILAFLFLFVSHITLMNFGSPLVLPAAYFIWAAVTVIILLSLIHIFIRWKLTVPDVSIYIGMFLLLLLLSAFFSPVINSHALTFETAGLIGGIILFVSLHQFDISDGQKERVLYMIMASAVIESLIGLFQYFNPGTGVFLLVAAVTKNVAGNFQQQNHLASYIAASLIISLYLLTGAIYSGFAKWQRGLFYLSVMLMAFVLFLTGSRAGVIGAGAGALILLAARTGLFRRKAADFAVWFLIVVIAAGTSIAIEKNYHKRDSALSSVGRKLENTVDSFTGEDVRDTRITLYLAAVNMIKDRPVFGHGPGNFSSIFMKYKSSLAREHPEYSYEPSFTTHPHNELLYRTAESGLVGGAGLLAVGLSFIFCMYRLGRERGGTYAALLFPLAFQTQVSFPFYVSMLHWVLFIFLLYLPSSHFVKDYSLRRSGILRAGSIAAAATVSLLVIYFLINTLNAQRGMVRYSNELMSKGIINTELLGPSLRNLYLNQVGLRLLMDARLRIGLMKGDMKMLSEFVEYSKEERKVFPHNVLYKREARALFDLGRRAEAHALIDEGLSIYPGREGLVETKRELIREETEEAISRKMELEVN